MKRDYTPTPPSTPSPDATAVERPSPLADQKPALQTPPSKKAKTSKAASTPAKTAKAKSKADTTGSGVNGDFTPEKKQAVMAKVVAAGIRSFKMSELADEFGVSKVQMANALQDGKKGNLRDRAIQAMKAHAV